jgi:hypothetical protein
MQTEVIGWIVPAIPIGLGATYIFHRRALRSPEIVCELCRHELRARVDVRDLSPVQHLERHHHAV